MRVLAAWDWHRFTQFDVWGVLFWINAIAIVALVIISVIVLVRDGDRVLLARKAGWAPGRYALVAGFVDNGESLEGCVAREVKEEVGVDVTDIQYVGCQNWPFPSQLMVGFVARYAGGELQIDREELEDARWFPRAELPSGPSRHSIAGFILERYARQGA